MKFLLFCVLLLSHAMITANTIRADQYRGREFVGISDFGEWQKEANAVKSVWVSPEYPAHITADEIVLSWNADTPPNTGLTIEARATKTDDTVTKWYILGKWSKDGTTFPRESVDGQKDSDGTVATDTLVLKSPPKFLQVRVTLHGTKTGIKPTLKFIGISFADTKATTNTQEANRAAWGKEVTVPSKTQLGWKDANGWCSPTSTSGSFGL